MLDLQWRLQTVQLKVRKSAIEKNLAGRKPASANGFKYTADMIQDLLEGLYEYKCGSFVLHRALFSFVTVIFLKVASENFPANLMRNLLRRSNVRFDFYI